MTNEEATLIGDAIALLANSITPMSAVPGTDPAGGKVRSLTEAAMGMTEGLFRIAAAIEGVGERMSGIEEQLERTQFYLKFLGLGEEGSTGAIELLGHDIKRAAGIIARAREDGERS